MFDILTTEEMRQADQAAIAAGQKGIDLMRAAGLAVVSQIADSIAPCPVLVLCGPGNNGGDGFIIAAGLMQRGWPVRLACLAKTTDLKGDANFAAREFTGKPEALNSNLALKDTHVIVDAVFGSGFSGALDPELLTLFDKIRIKKLPVVAVDLPSGINATTGQIAEGTLQATLTVTFCRRKVAHMIYPARQLCGRIVRADIGISDECVSGTGVKTFENHPALWLNSLSLPGHESHKYTRGHAVVYGGTHRTGAACLSAMAAQRAGVGAVTLLSKPESALVYRTLRPSLMVDEWHDDESYRAGLRDIRRTALIIGPGALPASGGEEDFRQQVLTGLSFNKATVLDGDVFRVFEHQPSALFAQLSPGRHVLTPHSGEFIRLFGSPDGSKLEQARAAAKRANAVVVYKGADTVIATPEGLAVIDVGGPPTLATAGSGDVLSGLIGGFAAQGMPPFFAACAGVWFQGQAARKQGAGLVAEDLICHISQVFNDLFNGTADNL